MTFLRKKTHSFFFENLNIRSLAKLMCLFFVTNVFSQTNMIYADGICKVWGTGSTYKIMKNSPIPKKKGKVVLYSAKNETESFQLVLTPYRNLNGISLAVSDFRNTNGEIISSENIVVRQVEYVHVTKPSGRLHKAGWYPDPLPLYEKPLDAIAGENTPIWFTVKVPSNISKGKYAAHVNLKSGSWEVKVPIELNVWNFSLPEVPSMRSGFGLYSKYIKKYHNLDTEADLDFVMDEYYKDFKNYKISPYGSYKVNKTVKGVLWKGGTFDPYTSFRGRYSYQVTDTNEGSLTKLIEIDPNNSYLLKWYAKVISEGQKYTVTVKCYDENKKSIDMSLKWGVYKGTEEWVQDTLYIDSKDYVTYEGLPDYRPFPKNARYASVHLYSHVPGVGDSGGTVWFDDFEFIDKKTKKNLFQSGGFEQDIAELDLVLDFTEFDKAARKYLDGLGFSGFRMSLSEVKPGPYKGKKLGWFNGFVNGTPEYEKLIELYLKGFQDHLEANGWLGKEYFYWVDEPKHEDYDFVREGMKTIHRVAPKLTRLITENNPGPEIMGDTEIGCPVFYKVNPDLIKEWSAKGRDFWSYLMCWPKEPHVSLFIDSDAINMRIWLWMSYIYNLKGILVWNSNHWNGASAGALREGAVQNIWEDPMTYKSGHGTPYGSAPEFGNGDGMLFYPPNRNPNTDRLKYLIGPVPSIRLEILRDGLDDYDYMMMLEDCIARHQGNRTKLVAKARKLLDFRQEVFASDTDYTKNPEVLTAIRLQMGYLLDEFFKIQK